MLADLGRDSRYGLRLLARSPGFSLVAILTMALGIGATSAMFSVVNGVLLRPLPYPDPDDLLRVHEVVPQYGTFSVAPANFLDWRRQNTVFAHLAAFTGGSVTLPGDDGPERIQSASASADLFDVLDVRPALGRGFRAAEDAPGGEPVAVLSHGLWQRRFGSEASVLGRSVVLNGRPTTIIGVMPRGFYFPSRAAELWMPLALDPAQASRGGHYLGVIGRRKPGVALRQAEAEMKAIAERLASEYPDTNAKESAAVVPLHEQVVGRVRPALITLFAAVGIVVLIACANVANLLLVRCSVREKEIAIRAALGAGGRRIAAQMLAESLILALAGGALGLLLARAALPAIQLLSAGQIPRVEDLAIDGRVLGFAALVSALTGLAFGVVPAWHASRPWLAEALKDGGRGASLARGGRLRGGLLVGEVALSIVLLVGASLLLRSFASLTRVHPGFDADPVLAFQLSLPKAGYPDGRQQVRFFEDLLQRLRGLPRVGAAGVVQTLPMRGDYVLEFRVAGRPPAAPGEETSANYRSVSPEFHRALGIPLLRGRAFGEPDAAGARNVAVVDQAFVDRHFPGEDPLGRSLKIGNGTNGAFEIVGVCGNVRWDRLDATPRPTMYVPYAQDAFGSVWVVVRSSGDPASLAPAARQSVRALDGGLAVARLSPLREVLAESLAQRRFAMLLLGLFALIALFLAAVGLYGVVAYTVAQRTREIGLRMAIGARERDVLRQVVGGGMKLAAAGVAVGLAAALALARVVTSMLYAVTPFDLVSYLATASVLLAVAALACYVPAARAARLDPLVALREE